MGKYVKVISAVACLAAVGMCSCQRRSPQQTNSQMPDRGPHVEVTMHDPNAFPEDIEVELAIELEKTLMTLAGSKTVVTSCQPGLCVAKIYFESDTNLGASVDLVRRELENLEALPPVEVSVVQGQSLILTVDVCGDLPVHDLMDAAETVRTQILGDLPDSVTAEITGRKETHIRLDSSRMARFAITAERVLGALRSARDTIAPNALPSLEIDQSVLLGDIATLSEEYAGPVIRTDGRACVEIKLYAPSRDHAIAAAKRVRESVDKHRTDLPENIQCRTYSHVESAEAKPVRLRVIVDLPRLLSTDHGKQEVHHLVASPLGSELAKLEAVEGVRSVVTDSSVIIELTFGSDVQFEQAAKLLRDKDIKVEIPEGISGPDPVSLQMRRLPLAIEGCPPTLVARVDTFGSDDISTLAEAAGQVAERLRKVQGIGRIEMLGLLGSGRETLRPRVHVSRLAELGISPQEIIQEVTLSTQEGEVVQIDGGAGIVRVLYRDAIAGDSPNVDPLRGSRMTVGGQMIPLGAYRDENAGDSRDPSRRLVMTKDGQMIPLNVLAEVNFTREIQEITRVDGIRVGSMNVYSDGTCDTAEVTQRIRNVIDDETGRIGDGMKARLHGR